MPSSSAPVMILLRGLPGSGKSTFARTFWLPIFEADDYFMVDGEYKFDAAKLGDAHAQCFTHASAALAKGQSVVVANTFIERWQMSPYISLAEEKGYTLFILTVENWHGSKDIHGVPEGTLKRMKSKWFSW